MKDKLLDFLIGELQKSAESLQWHIDKLCRFDENENKTCTREYSGATSIASGVAKGAKIGERRTGPKRDCGATRRRGRDELK